MTSETVASVRPASRLLAWVMTILAWAVLNAAAGAPLQAAERATIVVDAKTGATLHEEDADAPRYPASLTKMMTLYILFDLIEQKRLGYESRIRISEHAANQPPSSLDLEAGSTISVHDAVLALITKSANDVAAAVGEHLAGSEEKFARIMTWKARQIGMRNTTFRNASGLPDPQQITTARDMSILAVRLVHDFPEHYKQFAVRTFTYGGQTHRNHNTLLGTYQGTDGIKTGYVRSSGFNLVASVRRGDKHVIGVVLGGRSAGDRNSRMRALLASALGKARSIATPLPAVAHRPGLDANRKAPPAVALNATPNLPRPAQTERRASDPARKPQLAKATATTPTVPAAAVTKTAAPPAPAKAVVAVHPEPAPRPPAAMKTIAAPRAVAPTSAAGPFHIQVGAYVSQADAQRRLITVANVAGPLLAGHAPITTVVSKETTQVHRARFASFTEAKAIEACQTLKARSIDCIVMRAE